ncbi:uncharacterized protein RHIMIDRAFT_232373 [Rhizopus microsporus ATCC 52813]|uniref:Uncharacterized protein n=1 Tax=Rhizopus microsporus ATCC 52813 TaxID=1340429 RepID=A0A2G4T7E3_RHIZD|nr:uncharacterized protein RHIMIDRAFT_232373 [Rhizopus microsporus ATCC 52813]PHZ16927.1 hypothetical protein RHIMIDRAFT_232373 [Rhizopus microsporus ATCC 52813]
MSQQQNIANLLDPLVSNADASIGKAYQTIAKAMEQTLKVQQLTNLAMEQIYKANVKLDSHIEPTGNGNLRILFTLGNLSPLPMKTVKGRLRFEDNLKIEINIAQAAKIFDENNLETYETSSLFDSQVDLLPQTEYEQVIELTTKEPIQCNGTIEISFLNPSNEDTPIKIEHNFGLYLIDQASDHIYDCLNTMLTP